MVKWARIDWVLLGRMMMRSTWKLNRTIDCSSSCRVKMRRMNSMRRMSSMRVIMGMMMSRRRKTMSFEKDKQQRNNKILIVLLNE